MKYINPIIFAASLTWIACQSQKENATHEHAPEAATTEASDTVKKSIPREEHAQIGGTHFSIKYHAPAVRGRTIWGGLVPYGDVWVTGAHSATSLEIDHDVTINGIRSLQESMHSLQYRGKANGQSSSTKTGISISLTNTMRKKTSSVLM